MSTSKENDGHLTADNPFLDIARAPASLRKSQEPSPTQSLYSEDDGSAAGGKEFSIYHTGSHLNLRIVRGAAPSKTTEPKRDAEFYVDNSMWTPGKPDVTLIAGPEKKGAVVAVVKISPLFRHLTVGFGDPKSAEGDEVKFEKVNKDGVFKSKGWSFCIEAPELNGREDFVWKRTKDASLGAQHWDSRKLVRKETGEPVAVFLSNGIKSWRKMGKLKIMQDYGGNWEMMVLCSLIGLIEAVRRQRRAQKS